MPDERSDTRQRQFKHVKESELDRGESEDRAAHIAAATVNKTRVDKGETQGEARGGRGPLLACRLGLCVTAKALTHRRQDLFGVGIQIA